jgi:hypothetical protein
MWLLKSLLPPQCLQTPRLDCPSAAGITQWWALLGVQASALSFDVISYVPDHQGYQCREYRYGGYGQHKNK